MTIPLRIRPVALRCLAQLVPDLCIQTCGLLFDDGHYVYYSGVAALSDPLCVRCKQPDNPVLSFDLWSAGSLTVLPEWLGYSIDVHDLRDDGNELYVAAH